MRSRNWKYILDDAGNPVPEHDLHKWAEWFERDCEKGEAGQRIIQQDMIGEVKVSTIFLALDYNHMSFGQPILFETMIFGGKYDGMQERYETREQAIAGHQKLLKLVKP